MFVKTCDLTDEDKRIISDNTGKIMLGILNNKTSVCIADQINIQPNELEWNIDEILYTFKKRVGIWRYLKILFIK